MRFKPIADYVPGKTPAVAHILSRSPQNYSTEETETHADMQCYVAAVMQGIPATPHKMGRIRTAITTDSEPQAVIKLIRAGWPQHEGQIVPLIENTRL